MAFWSAKDQPAPLDDCLGSRTDPLRNDLADLLGDGLKVLDLAMTDSTKRRALVRVVDAATSSHPGFYERMVAIERVNSTPAEFAFARTAPFR